ncbi:MAG TPA: hypothetical protein VHW47_04630, partial [Acidimicrobiales bacterium]|nr:hypothetical protein [Acidimicrobiales bacterium]
MSPGRPERAPGGPPVPVLDGLVPVPTYRDRPATPVNDLAGVDLAGAPIDIRVLDTGHWTLLVFLSSGCDGCRELWTALADPAGSGLTTDETVVAVTHDPAHEDLPAVRRLAPPATAPAPGRVVMSSRAWSAYRVQGPPFFVLVDGAADRVVTEGVAWGVAQVAEHVR